MWCDDVVWCILSWLPVSSLLRFKLVCRSWRSIIETPDFIHQHTLHLQISGNDDEDGKLLVNDDSFNLGNYSLDDNFCLYSGKYFQSERILRFEESTGYSTSVRGYYYRPESIISSFNGIICLKNSWATRIYLCNPLTKQFRSLPSPSLNLDGSKSNLHRLGSCFRRPGDFVSGFGFDAKTRDYKLVLMLVDSSEDMVKSGIEVYSLRTNSWRIIDDVLPVNYIQSTPKSPLFSGGIYCWLGRCIVRETLNFLILSFDFATEMFDTMSVPDVYSHLPYSTILGTPFPILVFALLRGKIALLERIPDFEVNCKVWVLQEYGVKQSWTNLYTLRLESLAFLYGFSDNGMIIFGKKDLDTCESSLSLCDPATQEVMVISSKKRIEFETQVATYQESLVSIGSATDTCEGVGKKTSEESSSEESDNKEPSNEASSSEESSSEASSSEVSDSKESSSEASSSEDDE